MVYRQRKYAQCGSVPVSFEDCNIDQDEVEKLIEFLSGCKLPGDEEELKKKLENTIDIRKTLISQQDDTFPKMFEFYLVDPKMVII